MNTADRSIALVDAAMRRRFAFEQVHPSECPVRGLLDRWLHEHGHSNEAARLLDQLNTRIEDPDFAIGPSHFHAPGRAPPGRAAAGVAHRDPAGCAEVHHYGEGVDVAARYGLEPLHAAISAAASAPETEEPGPDQP